MISFLVIFIFLNINDQLLYSDNTGYDQFIISGQNLILSNNRSADLLRIIHLESKVEKNIIISGEGPGELNSIGAMAISDDNIYAVDVVGSKIVTLNMINESMQETLLQPGLVSNLSVSSKEIIVSYSVLKQPSQINEISRIAVVLDKNLDMVHELHFDLSILKLEEIKQYEKLRLIEVRPKVLSVGNRFMVLFEGHPEIFVLDLDSNLIAQKNISGKINNYRFKVTQRQGLGYGQRTPGYFYEIQKNKENEFYATIGSAFSDIPKGMLKISYSNSSNIEYEYQLFENQEFDFGDWLMTSVNDDTIYLGDGVHIFELE